MSPADMRASAFCSICAEDIVGEVVREPLGRLGALVAVCADCRTVTPTASYGRIAYEPPFEATTATPEVVMRRKRQAKYNRNLRARKRDAKAVAK